MVVNYYNHDAPDLAITILQHTQCELTDNDDLIMIISSRNDDWEMITKVFNISGAVKTYQAIASSS